MLTVLLPVREELYAVPIESVNEVLAAPTVTGLATAPTVVLGMINLRGDIVPLLDTAALLGVGTIEQIAFAVVVRTEFGPAALAATDFPQRAELGAPSAPSELSGTVGTFPWGRKVAVLLDPATLLTPERIGGDLGHQVSSSLGAG